MTDSRTNTSHTTTMSEREHRPRYQVTTTNGDSLDGTVYVDFDAAVEAIADRYGWAQPAQSGWFAVVVGDDGDGGENTEACCVYADEETCDADDEGRYAPRVIEIPTHEKEQA